MSSQVVTGSQVRKARKGRYIKERRNRAHSSTPFFFFLIQTFSCHPLVLLFSSEEFHKKSRKGALLRLSFLCYTFADNYRYIYLCGNPQKPGNSHTTASSPAVRLGFRSVLVLLFVFDEICCTNPEVGCFVLISFGSFDFTSCRFHRSCLEFTRIS